MASMNLDLDDDNDFIVNVMTSVWKLERKTDTVNRIVKEWIHANKDRTTLEAKP